MILAIFFFTIFAILGVSLWRGTVYQRCYFTELPVDGDWIADQSDILLCSDERKCEVNRYCGSLAVASRTPEWGLNKDIDIIRDADIEDLNFGITNFNHLGFAFLSIFQCTTLEGWINITNMYQDVYTSSFVQIYFVLCAVVCSMFVLNLTIAVMLLKYDEFSNSDEGQDDKDQELIEYAEQIGLPYRFIDFILEHDGIQISQKGLKMLQRQSSDDDFWTKLIYSDQKPDEEDCYYQNPVTRFLFYVVTSPIFGGFITTVIVINTLCLAMTKYPEWPESIGNVLATFGTIFTVVFTLEMTMKLIGLGVRGYCSDNMNIFDGILVTISLIETILAATTGASGGGGPFSALRAFRLFRIFKLFKSGDLRMLLESIILTVADIRDYTILLSLYIYVTALMGMSFFASKVKYDDDGNLDLKNGKSPRANFDWVLTALLTVFEIIIGENWNAVMYDHMRGVGYGACIYFIIVVCTGNIIMLNLFLAILLGNFDRARNSGGKKKIFDAF